MNPTLRITSYHRTFQAPGAPIVWAVEVSGLTAFGRTFSSQVIQLAETDDELNKIAAEMNRREIRPAVKEVLAADGNDYIPGADAETEPGPAIWDERTLIEATRRALNLTDADDLDVAKAPIVQA